MCIYERGAGLRILLGILSTYGANKNGQSPFPLFTGTYVWYQSDSNQAVHHDHIVDFTVMVLTVL